MSLLCVGFRRIHAFIAHQTEEFIQGMPTDLAFRLAGRSAVSRYLEKERGEGWWGDESSADYYSGSNNPFRWIQVHPGRSLPTFKDFPDDHAGKPETSTMMALHPEQVDLTRLTNDIWYARLAASASAEYGQRFLDMAVADMEKVLWPENS